MDKKWRRECKRGRYTYMAVEPSSSLKKIFFSILSIFYAYTNYTKIVKCLIFDTTCIT